MDLLRGVGCVVRRVLWRTAFRLAVIAAAGGAFCAQSRAEAAPRSAGAARPAPFASRTERIGGEDVQILEKRNARGAIVGQILLAKSWRALWIDKNGDGRLERWELTNQGGTVSLREPSGDHFLFMDVEQRLRSGRAQLKFAYSSRSRGYSLFAAKSVPYATMHNAQDFVVGCQGAGADAALRELAIGMNRSLAQAGSDDALKAAIERRVTDSPCSQPPFSESSAAMVEAIFQVAKSDAGYQAASTRTVFDPKKEQDGNFLKCLRDFNMDVHASRIQAGLAQMMNPGQTTTAAPWSLTCELSHNPDDHGEYQPSGAVVLQDVRASASQYAATFFHEMLHYSGIDDDRIVRTIQGCCVPGAADASSACNDLRNLVRWQDLGQRFENQIVTSMDGQSYSALRDELRKIYGPQADSMVDNFYLEMGKNYDRYRLNESCHANRSDQSVLGSCEGAFRSELQRAMDGYFGQGPVSGGGSEIGVAGRTCVAEATSAFNDDQSKIRGFCEALQNLSRRLIGGAGDVDLTAPAVCRAARSTGMIWISALLPAAMADLVDEATSQLCATAQAQKQPMQLNFEYSASTAPSSYVSPGTERFSSPAERDRQAVIVGRTSTVTGSPGTQTSIPSSGPPSPTLSRDPNAPSARRTAIRDYLNGSQSTLAQSRSLAESVSRAVLPEARASSSGAADVASDSAPRGSARTSDPPPVSRTRDYAASARSPSARGSDAVVAANAPGSESGVSLPTPRTTLPDPLASGRAPAGVAGAGGGTRAYGAGAVRSLPPDPASAAVNPSGAAAGGRADGAGRRGAAAAADGAARPHGSAALSTSPNHAGAGGTGAHAQTEADRAKREAAFLSLLRWLEGPYSGVKPQLGRPGTIRSLREHGVQVIDDENGAHGAGDATCILRYQSSNQRLVREMRPPCRDRAP